MPNNIEEEKFWKIKNKVRIYWRPIQNKIKTQRLSKTTWFGCVPFYSIPQQVESRIKSQKIKKVKKSKSRRFPIFRDTWDAQYLQRAAPAPFFITIFISFNIYSPFLSFFFIYFLFFNIYTSNFLSWWLLLILMFWIYSCRSLSIISLAQ